jgi:hypothetical protein
MATSVHAWRERLGLEKGDKMVSRERLLESRAFERVTLAEEKLRATSLDESAKHELRTALDEIVAAVEPDVPAYWTPTLWLDD